MVIRIYKLNKKINSTLLPTADDLLITTDVVLKQSTSVDKPIFILAANQTDMSYIRIANYVEFNGNYFWITEINQLSNNHIEINCEIDVLASYKNEILDTTAYVIYSSSHGNIDTIDDRIGVRNDCKYSTVELSVTDVFTEYPTLILEISNIIGNSFSTPYILTGTEASLLKDEIMSPNFLETFSQWFSNPLEQIIQAKYTSANFNLNEFPLETIYVGQYSLNSQGHRFDPRKTIHKTKSCHIPWNSNDFRMLSPYTMISLYLPFVGIVNLDTSLLYKSNDLLIEIYIELISGNIIYDIYGDVPGTTELSTKIATFNGCCNTSAAVSQLKAIDPITLASGATLIALGMTDPKLIFTAIMGAEKAIQSFQQHSQINGAMGSTIGSVISDKIILNVWTKKTNCEPLDMQSILGLPTYKMLKLEDLSGYCQCANASVAAIAMPEEITAINNYLNGGFYIE